MTTAEELLLELNKLPQMSRHADRLNLLEDALSDLASDAKDDGRQMGYDEGIRVAKTLTKKLEDEQPLNERNKRFFEMIIDHLGWDRFAVARFMDTGIMQPIRSRT